jgi:hypothetical protein
VDNENSETERRESLSKIKDVRKSKLGVSEIIKRGNWQIEGNNAKKKGIGEIQSFFNQ